MSKVKKVLKKRGLIYGPFSDNAKITQQLMDTLKLGKSYNKLKPEHIEAFHMIFHKIARCVCGKVNYVDNITDISGYAKLLEDFLIKENKEKK